MRFSYASFVIRWLARSLREVAWTHALTAGAIATSLSVFGGFLLLQENLERLLRGWGERIQIVAYLNKEPDRVELQRLQRELAALPELERFRYISRRQAWEEFEKSLGAQRGLLEGLERDVLPASLEIAVKPSHRRPDAVEALAAKLRRLELVEEVEYPQGWAERLGALLGALRWLKWALGAVLFAAALFTVGSMVKLAIFARREEIEVLQLVGARRALVQAPFVLEGIIQGLLGAAAALGLLKLAFVALQQKLPPLLGSLLPPGQLAFLDVQRALLLLALGVGLGAAGGLIVVRRYLEE